MRARFLASIVAVAAAFAGTAAFAAPAPNEWVQPPQKLPHVQRGNTPHNLDFLFGALKVAPDDVTAKAIEGRIWAMWAATRSDTTTLLMSRAQTAVEQHDADLALKLLDAVIKIRPAYVDAWNRRATIFYLKKDYGRALADLREVLRREPRHFGALSGLGLIMQDLGDDKQALEVYRRALAVYPRLERIPEVVKELQQKVEGRDI
jgi:tetratricopeptide (TPR) repeat protein